MPSNLHKRFDTLNHLLDVYEKLGERERLVLGTYAQRLWNGQRKYGPMTLAKKDWPYEAIEEALDASVYLAAMLNDRVEIAFTKALKEAEDEAKGNRFWEEDSYPGGSGAV